MVIVSELMSLLIELVQLYLSQVQKSVSSSLTFACVSDTLKTREGSSRSDNPCAVPLDKIAGQAAPPPRKNSYDNARG